MYQQESFVSMIKRCKSFTLINDNTNFDVENFIDNIKWLNEDIKIFHDNNTKLYTGMYLHLYVRTLSYHDDDLVVTLYENLNLHQEYIFSLSYFETMVRKIKIELYF